MSDATRPAHSDRGATRSRSNLVGAIDIGSNSINLLITDRDGNVIERVNTTTRLGKGVGSKGTFDPESIDRTRACLTNYRTIISRHDIGSIRCVATSAARRVADFAAFAVAACDILGSEVEVITGEEEGRLAYVGALSRLDPVPGSNLVLDIGAGSTELSLGRDHPETVHSLETGAVRLTESHLRADPPLPEELTNAIAEVQDLVVDACRATPELRSPHRIIGCSGTIMSIAAVEIGSLDVPNGFVLTRAAVEDVFRTLATESISDRIHNPGLSPQRADIIVAGCCILVGILRSLGGESVTVSSGNILDGICRSLIGEDSSVATSVISDVPLRP